MMLTLVVIRAADSERSVGFYRLLGMEFEKHRHGKGQEHFACELCGIVFEIYPRKDDTDSTASVRLGFRVASLDKIIAELESSRVKIFSPPKDSPWGRRAVVEDPDGHKIELTEAV